MVIKIENNPMTQKSSDSSRLKIREWQAHFSFCILCTVET